MNWTITKMEFDGNYAQIRSTDMNELLVQGGKCSYKSTKQSTSAILIATVFFLFLFSIPFLWDLYSHLYYISPFIFILHVDS